MMLSLLASGIFLGACFYVGSSAAQSSTKAQQPRTFIQTTAVGEAAIGRVRGRLQFAYDDLGLTYGAPIYLRVIKDRRRLEVWVQGRNQEYLRLRSYRLCGGTQNRGPRRTSVILRQPEGFYHIGPTSLRPPSVRYLGADIGWPNAFDIAQNKRGGVILVQAGCANEPHIGLTDPDMEEVYALLQGALTNGQAQVPIHIFPYEMTMLRMITLGERPNTSFWKQLAPAWQAFESTKKPPQVRVLGRRYIVLAR
jgi:murein L,D-transpeptidase YafK